jgi:hypothetical protein
MVRVPSHVWPPGVASHYPRTRHALRGFVPKVQAGEDLNPFLSLGVNTRGYILPGPGAARDDRDMVLTRMGLHHFQARQDGLQPRAWCRFAVVVSARQLWSGADAL